MNTLDFINRYWIIGLLLGGLVLGCGMSDPEGKDTSGAIDVAVMKNPPQDAEGSFSKTAPPLNDQQIAQGQLKEGSGSALEDHPDLATYDKVQRQLVVPKTVEGKWKAVKILVRDKTDDELSRMQQVDLGQSFTFGGGAITVRAGPFLPNFVLTKGEVTSLGNELKNPAVKLVITENGREIYNGWTFAMYPALYAFEHERYSLQLMDFIPTPVG